MNENNFQKRYSASSQKIKDFLISEELYKTIKNIVTLTRLDTSQTTELTEMISNVLLGQISPIDFYKKIESSLKVSPSQARIIIELAKKKIFEQFSKELEQYKSQLLEQKIPQEIKEKESMRPLEPEKVKPMQEEEVKQIIPEYSFPEASEVKVEKPVSKIEELKKVVTPKVPPEQQEKIREKLLAAMQSKDIQPEIIEKMKKVSFKKPAPKEKKEPLKKKPIEEIKSSEVLSGEGEKFKDEEIFEKTKKERPYILGAKLKEEKEKKEKTDISEEPIPYKKYQKENPFGQA